MMAISGAKELKFIKSFVINFAKAVTQSSAFEDDDSFWFNNVVDEATMLLNLSGSIHKKHDIKKFNEDIVHDSNEKIVQIYKAKVLNDAHFISDNENKINVYKSPRVYKLTISEMIEKYNYQTGDSIKKFRSNSVVMSTPRCSFTASAAAELSKDEVYEYIFHSCCILLNFLLEHSEMSDCSSDGVTFCQETFYDFVRDRFPQYDQSQLSDVLYYNQIPTAVRLDPNDKQITMLIYKSMKQQLLSKCTQADFDYVNTALKRLFVALDSGFGFEQCAMYNFVNNKYHLIRYMGGTKLLISTDLQDLCGMVVDGDKRSPDDSSIIDIKICNTCTINITKQDLGLQYYNLDALNQSKCITAAILMCINDNENNMFENTLSYPNTNLMHLMEKGHFPKNATKDISIDIVNGIDNIKPEESSTSTNNMDNLTDSQLSKIISDILNDNRKSTVKENKVLYNSKISYGSINKTKFVDSVMSTIVHVGINDSIITSDMNLLKMADVCNHVIAKNVRKISNFKAYWEIQKNIKLQFLCAQSMTNIRMYSFCETSNHNDYEIFELKDAVIDELVGNQFIDTFKEKGILFPLYMIGNEDIAVALKRTDDEGAINSFLKSAWKSNDSFIYDSILMLKGALLQAHILYTNNLNNTNPNNIVLKDTSFKELLQIFESNILLNNKNSIDAMLFMLNKKNNKSDDKPKLNYVSSINLPTGESYVTKENDTYEYNKSSDTGIFDYNKRFRLKTKDMQLTILPCDFTNSEEFVEDIVKILQYLKYMEETQDVKKCDK